MKSARSAPTYCPNSLYAASTASSDYLVRAWHHTYGLPTVISNCSNNFGPYHFPEKLIPLTIIKALEGEKIPVYGTGMNVRDWLYVEDHARALLAVEFGDPLRLLEHQVYQPCFVERLKLGAVHSNRESRPS